MTIPPPRRTADPPEWTGAWIGLPYDDFGRGPLSYDCWGLVRRIEAKVFGIELPSYVGDYSECGPNGALDTLFDRESTGWSLLAQTERGQGLVRHALERSGDVILMRHGRMRAHVGVVAGGRWMVHIQEKMASCVERYDEQPWCNKIVGIYRPPAAGAAT